MSSSARGYEQKAARQHQGGLQTRQPGWRRLLVQCPAHDHSVIVEADPRHQRDAALADPEPASEAGVSFAESHERDGAKSLVDEIQEVVEALGSGFRSERRRQPLAQVRFRDRPLIA